MKNQLTLQQIKIFIAVFDEGTTSLAAKKMRLSQSAVSASLSKMRSLFNDELYTHSGGRMTPTARATQLVEPMRDVCSQIETRILKTETFDPLLNSREFKIAASDVAEVIYYPALVLEASSFFGQVALRTVELPQIRLQAEMLAGRIDVALGNYPDITTSEFHFRSLDRLKFVCVCGMNSKFGDQKISMADYVNAFHVEVSAPQRSKSVLEHRLQSLGIQRKVALATPHYLSLPYLLGDTEMIATVPDKLAHKLLDSGRVRSLQLPFVSPVSEICVYWSKFVHNDAGNRWLRTMLFNLSRK